MTHGSDTVTSEWPDHDRAEPPSQAFAIARWLLRVAAWDGMLPAVVWSLPLVAVQLFPAQRWPVEVLGVVLPITAFLIRFFVGVGAIRSNHFGRVVRGLQGLSLWTGLFLLLIVDTLQILRLIMPPGAFRDRNSIVSMAVLYGIYVFCMAFAMYPSRAPAPPQRTSGTELPEARHLRF